MNDDGATVERLDKYEFKLNCEKNFMQTQPFSIEEIREEFDDKPKEPIIDPAEYDPTPVIRARPMRPDYTCNIIPLLGYKNINLRTVLSLKTNPYLACKWQEFIDDVPKDYIKLRLYDDLTTIKPEPRHFSLTGRPYDDFYRSSPMPHSDDPRHHYKGTHAAIDAARRFNITKDITRRDALKLEVYQRKGYLPGYIHVPLLAQALEHVYVHSDLHELAHEKARLQDEFKRKYGFGRVRGLKIALERDLKQAAAAVNSGARAKLERSAAKARASSPKIQPKTTPTPAPDSVPKSTPTSAPVPSKQGVVQGRLRAVGFQVAKGAGQKAGKGLVAGPSKNKK